MDFASLENVNSLLGIIVAILTIWGIIATTIAKRVKIKNKNFEELFSEEDKLLQNVGSVLRKLESILLDEAKTGSIEIQNFGLDLETVIPWLLTNVTLNEALNDIQVSYKGLIIDPHSPSIKPLIDGNSDLRTVTVKSRIEEIKKIELRKTRKLEIALKSYVLPPVVHGFLINKKHLFMSFTEIKKSKIKGGSFPYIYMELDFTSELNKHYFNMFQTWFDYTWEKSPSTYHKLIE